VRHIEDIGKIQAKVKEGRGETKGWRAMNWISKELYVRAVMNFKGV
jgi:hypothetical protein